jgi:hypothetical protein
MRLLIFVLLLTPMVYSQELKVTVQQFEAPEYPRVTQVARIMGTVNLFLKLRPDGTVASVRVGNGFPMFLPGAIESAKKWRFQCWECKFPDDYEHHLTFSYEFADCHGILFVAGIPVPSDQLHSFEFPSRVRVYSCYPT